MRSRYQPRCNIGSAFVTFHNLSKSSKIFDSTVGTTSYKNIVNRLTDHAISFSVTHVVKRLRIGSCTSLYFFRFWDGFGNAHSHSRVGTKSNHRINFRTVKSKFFIKSSTFIGMESGPILHGFVPSCVFRCKLAVFDVGKGFFVGCDHTPTCTHFDT